MNRKYIAWLGLIGVFGYGCSVGDPSASAEDVASNSAEYAIGLDGPACGQNRCMADEVCCSEACGACAKPGAACVTKGCVPHVECASDAHCSVAADYCFACDCLALSKNLEQEVPACYGPGVQCAQDPCRDRAAVCHRGQCVLE